jgi:hypothetical protein
VRVRVWCSCREGSKKQGPPISALRDDEKEAQPVEEGIGQPRLQRCQIVKGEDMRSKMPSIMWMSSTSLNASY